MKSPQVSVFMPTKNRSTLVTDAIASVLRQSYQNLELIVVDDGSTDDTPAVLEDLARQDPRLTILRNDVSIGAPASRNRAIAIAKGHWITGLDDDDYFHPLRIEAFVDFWKLYAAEDSEPLSGLFSQDDFDNGRLRWRSEKRGSVLWRDLFRTNIIGNQIFTLTEWLRAIDGFDAEMPAWQDLDLLIRLLKARGPAKLVDLSLQTVSADERPDRISRTRQDRFVFACERIIQKHPDAHDFERQSLYLQIFGDYYDFTPGIKDIRTILGYGWDNANMRILLKSVGRSSARLTGLARR